MATVNMYRKFSEVWTCHFMQAHRQTDRHAHCNTLHPSIRGRVTKEMSSPPAQERCVSAACELS